MSRLAIEDLTLSISGRPILDRVSLAVDPGEIVGVVGESGSGKSLTALSVMRLLPPGAVLGGRLSFGGRDLGLLSEPEMCGVRGRDVSMVFQEPMSALNPLQTIGDQVAETVRVHGQRARSAARTVAETVLARVGLPADRFPLTRFPHELSGGQRQRVGIAMAIALRPSLLIADEPTTALDVTTQAQILALLRRLVAEDGMGLLLISHDLAVVAGMADRIVIMHRGQVVEQGATGAMLRARRHPYTRALFAASAHRPARRAKNLGPTLLTVDAVVRNYRVARHLFRAADIVHAVRGASFTIRSGESVGLVGESGSGKSTLVRAILGLEALQGGSVEIDGAAVRAGEAMPASLRAKMQMVFQDPYGSFNPRHRVSRLIGEPFHLLATAPRGTDRLAAISRALVDVGLAPADADRFIHEFSGGQRQRIAIARALIIRPKLIVLDEAVSALDVRVRAQILDLLVGLSDRFGLAYLIVSHDLGVVRSVTDRVLVMKDGEIVEQGPTGSVLDSPSHPYTRSLVAASPVLALGGGAA